MIMASHCKLPDICTPVDGNQIQASLKNHFPHDPVLD